VKHHNTAMKHNEVGPSWILSAKKEEMTDTESSKEADRKIEGRKKRVLLGYYLTSVTYLILAIQYAYGSIGVSSQTFPLQFVASGYTLIAGYAYILASAVKGGRLSSDTYKRMNLSLIVYGLLNCVSWKFTWVVDTVQRFPLLLLWAPFLTTVNAIKGYTYGVLGINKAGKASILGDLKDGITSTMKGYLALPKNLQAAGYLGATYMFTMMTVAKLVEILRLLNHGASGLTVCSRVTRLARYTSMTTVLYTLKDAADRGRLNGTTFIELNMLSSFTLAILASFWGVATPSGGAAAVFSVFSAINGITSIIQKRQS